MIEKRFKLIDGIKKGTHSGIWDNQKQHNQGIGDELWLGEVVGMLNEGVILADENDVLKQQLKTKYIVNKQYEELQRLKEENEQLKTRNDNQAKQLDNLYQLIEQKDWRALTKIIDDFKQSDEQLQKEWGTYGDVE